MTDTASMPGPACKRRSKIGASVLVVILLLVGLLADSYAIYRIHVQRLGNALDFYPFWAGGRVVTLERHNPYDPAVMSRIQQAIYGRPARADENQHGYAYPAYAALIVLPFLALPFPLSASLWIAGQQVLVVTAVILTVQASKWKLGAWPLAFLSLAAMAFRYSMITFVLGQTSIWVLGCLALALWAAQRQKSVLAGVALAAGAIKPQLIVLPALALLASLPSRQRGRTFLALGGTSALLVSCSFLLVGPWLTDYWHQLQAYQGYSTTQFPLLALAETWLPSSISRMVNVTVITALLSLLATVFWRWRSSGRAVLPVALAVVVTQMIVPQTGSYNLVLLLLPAVVALRQLDLQLKKRWATLAGQVLVGADLLVFPWIQWFVVQYAKGISIDQVAGPGLLLIVLVFQTGKAYTSQSGHELHDKV